MSREFVGSGSVSRNNNGATRVTVPPRIDEFLGEPEEIAWFVNRDKEVVEIVNVEEVGLK